MLLITSFVFIVLAAVLYISQFLVLRKSCEDALVTVDTSCHGFTDECSMHHHHNIKAVAHRNEDFATAIGQRPIYLNESGVTVGGAANVALGAHIAGEETVLSRP